MERVNYLCHEKRERVLLELLTIYFEKIWLNNWLVFTKLELITINSDTIRITSYKVWQNLKWKLCIVTKIELIITYIKWTRANTSVLTEFSISTELEAMHFQKEYNIQFYQIILSRNVYYEFFLNHQRNQQTFCKVIPLKAWQFENAITIWNCAFKILLYDSRLLDIPILCFQ